MKVHACVLMSVVLATRVLAVEPVKPTGVPDEEKARLIAAESADQKQLRTELAELAKKGEKIYFESGGKILVMGPDGSGAQCVASNASGPHASPDGKKLVVGTSISKEEAAKLPQDPARTRVASGAVVAVLDLETKALTPVVAGGNAYWHPDGKKICYNTDGAMRRIGIYDVEKKTEVILFHQNVPGSAMFPNFSADGKWVFTGGYPFSLVELSEDGTKIKEGGKVAKLPFSGCNGEISKDGKIFVFVIDTCNEAGGWLCYGEFNPTGNMTARNLPLGWPQQSVNYYPDISVDGKYMVYSHAELKPGVESWKIQSDMDLYVTRFPDCKTTVRVTWNRGVNRDPNWGK